MKEADSDLGVRITVHGSYMPTNNRIRVLGLTYSRVNILVKWCGKIGDFMQGT